jgi:hypothetical protein
MIITDIKLTSKLNQPKRKEFEAAFKVNGVPLKGEVLLMRDDGSIPSARGKWYASIEIGKWIDDWTPKGRVGFGSGCCVKCDKDLDQPLFDAFKPLLEVNGIKLAHPLGEGKGWDGLRHLIPNTGEYETVGTRRAGRECVVIYLEAPALCPVHGKTITEDTDAAD